MLCSDTPLHYAITRQRQDLVRLLLARGADLAAANCRGFNSLHLAALRGDVGALRALLAEARARGTEWLVDEAKDDGYSALHLAALNGQLDAADALINEGHATVNARNARGQTPLHLAVETLNKPLVLLLLDAPGTQVRLRSAH